MKHIAVEGMTLQPDVVGVVCIITITGVPSEKMIEDGKKVYVDGTMLSVTNITAPGAPSADPGPYNVPLNSSAQYNKLDSDFVLLEGDKSDIINASPKTSGGTTVPTSFHVEIVSAGQVKVNEL